MGLGNEANRKGHHQVLWLYGDEIIEVGASNIFFVFKAANNKTEIVTPELKDLILPGITRDSIIVSLGFNVATSQIKRKLHYDRESNNHSRGY